MRCNIDKNLLSAFLDEELPDKLKIKIERHLKTCNSCNEELNFFKSLKVLSNSFLITNKAPFYLTSKTISLINEQNRVESFTIYEKIFQGKYEIRTALTSIITVFVLLLCVVSIKTIDPLEKFNSLAHLKQNEMNIFQDLEIPNDDLYHIGDANFKNIAMLLDFDKAETRKIYDSITFFNDELKQPVVETNFEW